MGWWMWQQWPDERLHIVFCDVGQGDATVIVLGSFQALIDTGADKNKVMACLSKNLPFWDRRVEVIFISHFDKDHAGALDEVKVRYKVGRVVDNPRRNDMVRFGSLSFDIIKGSWPEEGVRVNKENESNAGSVVMWMKYEELEALFTGDVDLSTELALAELGVLKKADVLKVSHHGSKYGSRMEFLEAVRPKMAVISVGAKNNYGHPSSDTLIRLEAVGAKVFRTDKMGAISIVSDGKSMEVFREK